MISQRDPRVERQTSYKMHAKCWMAAILGWSAISFGCSKRELVVEPSVDITEEQSEPIAEPWFSDARTNWGVHFAYQSGHKKDFLFPEIIGGGGALFDMDNDGHLDLYLVQGGNLKKPNDPAWKNHLYRNDGAGKLVDISQGSGADDAGYGMGVAAGDFDNDGNVDLYVTNVGKNVLLRNNGDRTFTDVTEKARVGDAGWGTSTAFFDADGDGFLDLYVCNYVVWSLETDLKCFKPSGIPDYCSPSSYNEPQNDVFYRNNGDGTFRDATQSSGMNATTGNGLGVLPIDFDSDGDMDLFVANDMTPNILWVNDGRGNFKDQAMLTGCAVDRDGQVKAGMGVCAGDILGKGNLSLLVVNLVGQSDSFFEYQNGGFIDRTTQAGLALISRPFTRFGLGLHDFDNDSYLDLFIANGAISLPDQMPVGDPFAEPNLLLRGSTDGRFGRVSRSESGDVEAVATSRGAIFGDLNNDGLLDIVVINRDSQLQILMNKRKSAGNWIGFDLFDKAGRRAIGATSRIKLGDRWLRRDVNPHYSYMTSNDPRVHFGLADTKEVSSIVVKWPNKEVEEFGQFDANQYHVLRAGRGRPFKELAPVPSK